jgi:hypothetical protein
MPSDECIETMVNYQETKDGPLKGLTACVKVRNEPHLGLDQDTDGMPACGVCLDLRQLPDSGWLFVLFDSIKDSAQRGCFSCSMLLNVISCYPHPPDSGWRKVSWHQEPTSLRIGLYTKLDQKRPVGIELFTTEGVSNAFLYVGQIFGWSV